jgi:hypothetical protein
MALTLVLAVYALGVAVTGGFDMRVSGVRIRSRSWERPAALAALGAVLLLWQSRRQVGGAGERIWAEVETKGGRVLAIGAAAWAVVAAVSFGAFAVGGSDSYGYVSQARLMAHGRLTDVVPLAPEFTWPDVEATLTPLGYTRGRSPGVIAPSYPPGLAILMAPLTPWEGAVHLLVPLFGVLTIWLAYRFGVLCGDPLAAGRPRCCRSTRRSCFSCFSRWATCPPRAAGSARWCSRQVPLLAARCSRPGPRFRASQRSRETKGSPSAPLLDRES